MAPLRRYLRITKYSVLEVRIYLDCPADAEAWLLKRDDPALPRVIKAIRPLVLPKLREENERGKGRTGKSKKKGVKDVVVEGVLPIPMILIITCADVVTCRRLRSVHIPDGAFITALRINKAEGFQGKISHSKQLG
jgi:hypothetical protein